MAVIATPPFVAQSSGAEWIIVYGDVVEFLAQTGPNACQTKSWFRQGEARGFRMTAINPAAGRRNGATELIVHIINGGRTVDVPIQDRQNEWQPERGFWIARRDVSADAPIGAVRYRVTAKDPEARTGEFTPFEAQISQHAIVE